MLNPRFYLTNQYPCIRGAYNCLDFLQQYSVGERAGQLSESEIARCVPISPKALWYYHGKKITHVVDIWQYSKWIRKEEAYRWSGARDMRVSSWIKAGLIERVNCPWLNRGNRCPSFCLSDVLQMKKCMLLVPYVRSVTMGYHAADMDALAMLPLDVLLGVITDKQLLRVLVPSAAHSANNGHI